VKRQCSPSAPEAVAGNGPRERVGFVRREVCDQPYGGRRLHPHASRCWCAPASQLLLSLSLLAWAPCQCARRAHGHGPNRCEIAAPRPRPVPSISPQNHPDVSPRVGSQSTPTCSTTSSPARCTANSRRRPTRSRRMYRTGRPHAPPAPCSASRRTAPHCGCGCGAACGGAQRSSSTTAGCTSVRRRWGR
jgi:hypothetical protein